MGNLNRLLNPAQTGFEAEKLDSDLDGPVDVIRHVPLERDRGHDHARVLPADGIDEIPPVVVIYLNRLSDLLFTLARVANRRAGAGEVTW